MNLERRIWIIGGIVSIFMLLVSTRIVYWQMVRGPELPPVAIDLLTTGGSGSSEPLGQNGNDNTAQFLKFLTGTGGSQSYETIPQPVIQRTIALLSLIQRGSILDRTGKPLDYDTEDAEGKITRVYAGPAYAHTLGIDSGLRIGVSGLEYNYNRTLLGLEAPGNQIGLALHQPIKGSDLILTIDSQVQQAAFNALQGKPGAVVVLNGHTGAVLAMASNPSFDPNRLEETGYVDKLLADCKQTPWCSSPFLNRATQALYTPGSTWKTVTMIAALDIGQVTPDTVFDFGAPVNGPNGMYYVYRVDGGVIPDPNHKESRLDLGKAYAKSANAAFARLADEMDPNTFLTYAARFGFGAPGEQHYPFDIDVTPSQVAQDPQALLTNNLLRAATGFGQGELLSTPLNMAMVVLPVLNKGEMPLPYLVQGIRNPAGKVNERLPNRKTLSDIMKPETASQVHDIMEEEVTGGSGAPAAVPGLVVGGKTGSAQVGGEANAHAWFIGYAEKGDQALVIAVLIENGGSGNRVAAPIFAQVAKIGMQQLEGNAPSP